MGGQIFTTITEELLFTFGARAKIYKKQEIIFTEGENARYFYQIIHGTVKMYNINEEGKIFTQGNFKDGCSFGEPPLFLDEVYPATAVALKESVILKLSKTQFFLILKEYPEIHFYITKILAKRLYHKSFSLKEFVCNTPEQKLISFFSQYKKEQEAGVFKIHIPFTRQEIADFVGLRVETVIRSLIKMNMEGKILFERKKIFY